MIPDQFRYSLELSFWRTQVRAISVQRMYLLHSLSVFFFPFCPLIALEHRRCLFIRIA